MKKRMKTCLFKRLLAVLLVISMCGNFLPMEVKAATNWKLTNDTEIYWKETEDSQINDVELVKQVQLFSSEMAEKLNIKEPAISYGDGAGIGNEDIVLVLDQSLQIKEQGFVISVDGTTLNVSASDKDGLFYGCREVIKQLLLNDCVVACTESPDVLERGLSLDNGRKYYSVEWIKKMIRELSWANMNAIALHFSEEMGLGIESKVYPWLAGRNGSLCTQAEVVTDNTVLTQEEIKEIVAYADLYHVEIIPSFDSPGHMNYIVKMFNEKCAKQDYSFAYNGKTYTAEAGSEIGNYFHYNGKTTIVKGSRNTNYSRGIDISNEVAVAFTRSLIEEYATLFYELGCRKFDIGGDELLGWGSAVTSGVSKWKQLDHWKNYAYDRAKAEGKANYASTVAYDGFMYYMNDLNGLVRSLGYNSVRMWNDDALRSSDTGWNGVVQLDDDIDIWFWTTGNNSVWSYANKGYQVYNILSDYNYYAMTSDYFSTSRGSFNQAYPDQIYNEWTPYTFDPDSVTLGTGKNMSIGNPNVLGSSFAIWSDNPTLRTENQIMDDVIMMIRAHGEKAWDAKINSSVPYSTFVNNYTKYGSAPINNINGSDIYIVPDQSKLEAVVEEFEKTDASLYTADSYNNYVNAVEEGKSILEMEKPLQVTIDASVKKIEEAKKQLMPNNNFNDDLVLYKATFTATRVNRGRAATLNVLVSTNAKNLLIYDSSNNLVQCTAMGKTTAKTNVENSVFICAKFIADTRGQQTYTIYAVDPNGYRSSDSIQASITVR